MDEKNIEQRRLEERRSILFAYQKRLVEAQASPIYPIENYKSLNKKIKLALRSVSATSQETLNEIAEEIQKLESPREPG